MSQAEFAVNFFVALFALLDPVGNVPLFAASTAGVRATERAQIAFYIGLFVIGFLTFFYFTGLGLLEFFGISLPAFRIAGGIILLLLGLTMARDDFTASFADAAEDAPDPSPEERRGYARRRFEKMIVPFGMPLLIGPGAISTVIIYASQARQFGVGGAAVSVGVIVAAAFAIFLAFLATPLITRILGKIGLTIVVRVLGLILCALAIQFILAGLAQSTLGFIDPKAASPYGH
jgi:multiple antibiotic resistance protein